MDEIDLDEFDITDEVLDAIERAEATHEGHQVSSTSRAQDEFDDIDMDALLLATESLERQREQTTEPEMASNPVQSRITSHFTSSQRESQPLPSLLLDESDPTPPPPPPQDISTYHPIDREALPIWIYPVNYPLRTYQLNIVQRALFSNTLVALPTGLGKTFIAAVVMYNYYRWFPQSKIIFMAPTRPLVKQQIEACFKVCGLPQSDTVELTGSNPRASRKNLWLSKRVFFLTPQVMENDLKNRICPASKIVCIVVDEAHKATGNYAYSEVVRELTKVHESFRVLALTATPGTNLNNVQTVLTNLKISNVQIRTEESMDIQEYSFGKRIQTVLCKLEYTAGANGILPKALQTFRDSVFSPVLERLKHFKVITDSDPNRNPSFRLLQCQKQFSANCGNLNQAVKSMVYIDFSIGISLGRAYEMLCCHGVGTFLASMDGILQDLRQSLASGKNLPKEKARLLNNHQLQKLMDELKQQQAQPGFIGHPKMESLLNIVLQHLSNASDQGTRSNVIIFSTYRNSVDDIIRVLSQHEPLVRCSSFVGQAESKSGTKGLNQREQQQVIARFRQGEFNTLVCTSIGEEGLDIGEVDLIVCYDSQSSPIRMLQRMGRTGRQRRGHCVMLMTEQEERKYRSAKESYSHIQRAIARSTTLQYYKPVASILPEGYRPVINRKTIVIGEYQSPSASRGRKRQAEEHDDRFLSNGLLSPATKDAFFASFFRGDYPFQNMDQVTNRFWPVKHPLNNSMRFLPLQGSLGPTKYVSHSPRTHQFVDLIKRMEYLVLRQGSASPENLQSPTRPSATVQKLKLPARFADRVTCTEPPKQKEQVLATRRMRQEDHDIPAIDQSQEDSPTMDDADHVLDLCWEDRETVMEVLSHNETISNAVPKEDAMTPDRPFEVDFGDSDHSEPDELMDDLEELYPLQTLQDPNPKGVPVVLEWDTSRPVFSEECLEMISKRQDRFKEQFGEYLSLGIYRRLVPGAIDVRTGDLAPKSPYLDDDFEIDEITASTLEKVVLQSRSKAVSQDDKNPNEIPVVQVHSQATTEAQASTQNDTLIYQDNTPTADTSGRNASQSSVLEWDFGDSMFSDFIENKLSEEIHSVPPALDLSFVSSSPRNSLSLKDRTPRQHSESLITLDDDSDATPIAPRIRQRKRPRILESQESLQSPKVQGSPYKMRSPRSPLVRRRPNPFLDLEAERSDDGVDTTEGEENDHGSSEMGSFIDDGSSGLVPTSSQGMLEESSDRPTTDMVSIYQKSLRSPDTLASMGMQPLFSRPLGQSSNGVRNSRRHGFRSPTWIKSLEERWKGTGSDPVESEEEETLPSDPFSSSVGGHHSDSDFE